MLQAGLAMTEIDGFRRCRPPKVAFFKNLLRSVPTDFLRRVQICQNLRKKIDLRPFSKKFRSKTDFFFLGFSIFELYAKNQLYKSRTLF